MSLDGTEWLRSGNAHALAFPPERLGIIARPLDDDSTAPLRAADVFAGWPDVQALINGPMFSRCDSEAGQRAGESAAQYYARLRCVLADYAQHDPTEDVDLTGRHPREGVTFSLVPVGLGADVRAARGATIDPDAATAVQTYPPLVIAGSLPEILPDPAPKYRCALGLLADGRLVFVLSYTGMQQFQRELRALGCLWAGYLDGGGSADLSTRDGTRFGSSERRPVGSWLAVLAPSVLRSTSRYARTHPVTTLVVASAASLATYAAVRALTPHPKPTRYPLRG